MQDLHNYLLYKAMLPLGRPEIPQSADQSEAFLFWNRSKYSFAHRENPTLLYMHLKYPHKRLPLQRGFLLKIICKSHFHFSKLKRPERVEALTFT